MKRMVVPMEIKAVGDTGRFSGYASIFGNVDLGGDIISKDEPFKEIVTNPDGKVITLFSHDSGGLFSATAAGGMPIGLADVSQDSKGLKFDAQLIMEDPFVQRVYTHLKAKTIAGMSIGYDILPGGSRVLESGVRELTALKLWEISPVIWGMNPKASIDVVKGRPTTIREFEDYARDVMGFSKSEARRLAQKGWGGISSDATSDELTVEKLAEATEKAFKVMGDQIKRLYDQNYAIANGGKFKAADVSTRLLAAQINEITKHISNS